MIDFLKRLFHKEEAPSNPVPPLKEYEFPADKLDEMAVLWDDGLKNKTKVARRAIWLFAQRCFPERDLAKGSWHLSFESVFHAYLREGLVEDWEDKDDE